MRRFLSNSGRRTSRNINIACVFSLTSNVLNVLEMVISFGTKTSGKTEILIRQALYPD